MQIRKCRILLPLQSLCSWTSFHLYRKQRIKYSKSWHLQMLLPRTEQDLLLFFFFKSQWEIVVSESRPVECGRPIWKSFLSTERFRPHLSFSKVVPSPSGPIQSGRPASTAYDSQCLTLQGLIMSTWKITVSSVGRTRNYNTQQASSKLLAHLGSK